MSRAPSENGQKWLAASRRTRIWGRCYLEISVKQLLETLRSYLNLSGDTSKSMKKYRVFFIKTTHKRGLFMLQHWWNVWLIKFSQTTLKLWTWKLTQDQTLTNNLQEVKLKNFSKKNLRVDMKPNLLPKDPHQDSHGSKLHLGVGKSRL